MLPDFQKRPALLKVRRLRSYVVLVRVTCRWRRMCSIGGMILTRKNWSTRRKTHPCANLYGINFTWIDMWSNTDRHSEGKRVSVRFHSMFPNLRKSIDFLKFHSLLPFVLVVTVTCRWRWVSITGGIIVTGENHLSSERTPYQCHCFYQKSDLDWPGMEPSLNCGSPAPKCLSHNTVLVREKIYLKNILKCSWYRAVNNTSSLWNPVTLCSVEKNGCLLQA